MNTRTYTFHNETPEALAMDLLVQLEIALEQVSMVCEADDNIKMDTFARSIYEVEKILAFEHYNKITKPASDK